MGQAIFSPLDELGQFGFRPPGRIAFLFPNTPTIALLNLFIIPNVCNALEGLVLSKQGVPLSVGAKVLRLLREPHLDRDLALSELKCRLDFEVRPRDWEPSLVAKLQDSGSAESEFPAAQFLYFYHEDRGEPEVAERHLHRALELCGASQLRRSGLAVEAAYVAGLHHRDGVKAREWLAQVTAKEIESHTRARAEAAALLAEKQSCEAIAVAEQGIVLSWKSVDPGGAKAERDWLQAIIIASFQALDTLPGVPRPISH